MASWLDSKVLNLLESGLNGLSLRHKVLADNIANVDTPNFKRSDVDFQQVLQAILKDGETKSIELKRTLPGHLSGVGTWSNDLVIQDYSTSFRNDGNNVDIDQEMSRLAQNTLQYNALATSLTAHLNMLRQVIQS
ncbi:MAG TPA: flagellar basal body rod protein FlgB [Peptococcaceae bacterium]|nr:flagellar basal body rod protein FlgB [Peptococcaceae bacterium]